MSSQQRPLLKGFQRRQRAEKLFRFASSNPELSSLRDNLAPLCFHKGFQSSGSFMVPSPTYFNPETLAASVKWQVLPA